MHWLAIQITGLLLLAMDLYGEECVCPENYSLVCDKTVAVSLAQPCASQCVDYTKPTAKGSTEDNACSVREEVMSQSRPAYLMEIKYHPCYCLDYKHYKPVCTTDFVTYLNQCTMACIRPGSIKAHDGACVSKNIALSCASCFKNAHPICATDGKSYSNPCMFQCFKDDNQIKDIKIAHDGYCLPEDSPFVAATLHKRSKHRESDEPNLDKWLLSMIDFSREPKRRRPRGGVGLPRNA